MNDVVGRYDWALSPNAAVWNRAYGFLARIAGLQTGRAFKDLCDLKDSSCVAFANCSPTLILNAVAQKSAARLANRGLVAEHLDRVFELADEQLPGRVKAVLLSVGPDFELRGEATAALARNSSKRGLPLVDAPYFGSRLNNEAFDARVPEAEKRLLVGIVRDFMRS